MTNWIFSISASPQHSERIIFAPQGKKFKFLLDDLLCNGTCSVIGGGGGRNALGGEMEKIQQKTLKTEKSGLKIVQIKPNYSTKTNINQYYQTEKSTNTIINTI